MKNFLESKLFQKMKIWYQTVNKCDVSLPFRAHVHSDNSERLKAYGKKEKEKRKHTGTKPMKQTKITFHPSCLDQQHSRWFSLLSTTIKLQTRMKRFVAVIAILKNGLFLQNVGGERVRADAPSHCEHMGETSPRKRDMHHQCCVRKGVLPKMQKTNKLQKMVWEWKDEQTHT